MVSNVPRQASCLCCCFHEFTNLVLADWCFQAPNAVVCSSSIIDGQVKEAVSVVYFSWTVTSEFLIITRHIFAFTRALCLGETLVLLNVVLQGFFGNDGLSCNCFCIGMLKMQGYYLCLQAEV